MDSNATTRCNIKHHLFGESSSSSASSSSDSNQQKRQRSIVSNEDGDCEPASAAILGKTSLDHKNKKPVECDTDHKKQGQDPSLEDLMGSSVDNAVESHPPEESQRSAEPDDTDDNNLSDICDDYYDDDDGEYEYDDDIIANDCSYSLAAKFDDMDLPPGVEATVSWLEKAAPEKPRSDKHIVLEEDIDIKYKSFKQFDTVDDYSDHYFANQTKDVKKR